MTFICMRIKNHFHINSYALSLALEQRLGTIPKWPTARHQPRSQGPLFLGSRKEVGAFLSSLKAFFTNVQLFRYMLPRCL